MEGLNVVKIENLTMEAKEDGYHEDKREEVSKSCNVIDAHKVLEIGSKGSRFNLCTKCNRNILLSRINFHLDKQCSKELTNLSNTNVNHQKEMIENQFLNSPNVKKQRLTIVESERVKDIVGKSGRQHFEESIAKLVTTNNDIFVVCPICFHKNKIHKTPHLKDQLSDAAKREEQVRNLLRHSSETLTQLQRDIVELNYTLRQVYLELLYHICDINTDIQPCIML